MNFSRKDKFLVNVYFKSGNIVQSWYTKMNVKFEGDKLTKVEWASVNKQNLFWALSEVEYIEVVKVKKSVWNLFNN